MTTFLNILFITVSVLFFAGRLYEIMFITDMETGFLLYNGIVSTPIMMGFIFVIAVCCGVIIFAGENKNDRIRKLPVGIMGIMAGVFFVIGGIVNSLDCFKYGGFLGYHMMVAAAGIGLIIFGVKNIKGKKAETLPAFLTMLLPVGVCLNAIVYEVKSISDIAYLMRNMAGICTMAFFLLLFKTVYSPARFTKAALYVASLLNFVFSGITSLAAVLGAVVTDSVNFSRLLYYVGFIFIGIYSVFISFYILPAKKDAEEENDDIDDVKPVKENKPPKKVSSKTAQMNTVTDYDIETAQTNSISRATIDALFSAKDAENKQEPALQEVEKTMAVPVKTVQVSIPKEKSVFRTDGKKTKSDTKKIVYKAPK